MMLSCQTGLIGKIVTRVFKSVQTVSVLGVLLSIGLMSLDVYAVAKAARGAPAGGVTYNILMHFHIMFFPLLKKFLFFTSLE
jgi:hypothetical protein